MFLLLSFSLYHFVYMCTTWMYEWIFINILIEYTIIYNSTSVRSSSWTTLYEILIIIWESCLTNPLHSPLKCLSFRQLDHRLPHRMSSLEYTNFYMLISDKICRSTSISINIIGIHVLSLTLFILTTTNLSAFLGEWTDRKRDSFLLYGQELQKVTMLWTEGKPETECHSSPWMTGHGLTMASWLRTVSAVWYWLTPKNTDSANFHSHMRLSHM